MTNTKRSRILFARVVQVEMAHKLSSSLYDEGNKRSKGQEMYMKRAKKSGKWVHGAQQQQQQQFGFLNNGPQCECIRKRALNGVLTDFIFLDGHAHTAKGQNFLPLPIICFRAMFPLN